MKHTPFFEGVSSDHPTDDIALLTNTPAQSEYVPHSPEQATKGTGLFVNANKIHIMCFIRKRSHLHCKWQATRTSKQVNKFIYQGSYISSTEKSDRISLAKAWNTIGRLLIIWISDFSDKIKWDFFQVAFLSILLHRCTTLTLMKRMEKNLIAATQNFTCCFEKS